MSLGPSGWQIKLCDPIDPSLTRAIPERFKDEFLVMRYTNLLYLLYRIVCSFVEGRVSKEGSLTTLVHSFACRGLLTLSNPGGSLYVNMLQDDI